MVTERERAQLDMEYRREPLAAGSVLLTCAAGLLMVIVLVLVGLDIHNYDQNTPPAQVAVQPR